MKYSITTRALRRLYGCIEALAILVQRLAVQSQLRDIAKADAQGLHGQMHGL